MLPPPPTHHTLVTSRPLTQNPPLGRGQGDLGGCGAKAWLAQRLPETMSMQKALMWSLANYLQTLDKAPMFLSETEANEVFQPLD